MQSNGSFGNGPLELLILGVLRDKMLGANRSNF